MLDNHKHWTCASDSCLRSRLTLTPSVLAGLVQKERWVDTLQSCRYHSLQALLLNKALVLCRDTGHPISMPAGAEKEADKLLQQVYQLLDKLLQAAGPVVGGRHAAVLIDMGTAGFKKLELAAARRKALGLLEVLQSCDNRMIIRCSSWCHSRPWWIVAGAAGQLLWQPGAVCAGQQHAGHWLEFPVTPELLHLSSLILQHACTMGAVPCQMRKVQQLCAGALHFFQPKYWHHQQRSATAQSWPVRLQAACRRCWSGTCQACPAHRPVLRLGRP